MLPGLGFDDCEAIRANSIEHRVQFRDAEQLDGLRGRPICLLFEICDADLYGFRAV